MRRRRGFVIALLALVLVAVGAGIALSHLRKGSSAEAAGPAAGNSEEPSTTASDDPVTLESAPASTPATRSNSTPSHTPTHKTSTSAAPSGPAISYFRVSGKPSCPSGTDQTHFEGDPVTLEWKVTGAEKATISVDGPGLYDTYGVKDSVTINFPCSGDPGSYQSHTFMLTAIGPNGTRTKTLTVKAKVNEITTT
ncbi:hypothetical protein [Actinoplanes sp. HUAS TT8]|uniref:hypothetical protein n=1 Tax=Actinoplanes sp. HUAS TT8 TaxID=3447453 RepID=UPI003F525A81